MLKFFLFLPQVHKYNHQHKIIDAMISIIFTSRYHDINNLGHALLHICLSAKNIVPLYRKKSIKMAKYINPYTDFGFKKLFGEEGNKALLVDFLNQLLPTHHQIKDLTFLNVEALPDSCLLYTSPSPRDRTRSRMPSSA